MSTRDALTAVRRFGLGPRPGEIAHIAGDPRGAVLAALARPDAAMIEGPGLEPSHAVFAKAHQATLEAQMAKAFREEGDRAFAGKDARPSASLPPPAAGQSMTMTEAAPGAAGRTTPPPIIDRPVQIRRQALMSDIAARIEHARTTDAGFVERLVMFWSNHFCVNANKGAISGIAGAYEREAIRPHVLGRFADMLRAVEQHPAMLIYLDNQASTGPNSQVGRTRNRGLNENLAREILELHTLGVDGGYTQTDVTNLARIITGWTVGQPSQVNAEHGKFFFAPARHEPGSFSVLGKSYGSGGVRTGEQALADLARHPSTARHIARKLATHFVSETPPPPLIAKLEKAFRDSEGDLAVVSRALVAADEAWTAPAAKITPPYDFLIGLQRAFGAPVIVPQPEFSRLVGVLGQSMWRPPSPKGWPDGDESWASPSTLRERLRVAERASVLIAQSGQDARAVAQEIYADALGTETRQAIARAEAREQAFALLMMSPEFLRR
jgi:uncharacterized protein (DUF1800 family)